MIQPVSPMILVTDDDFHLRELLRVKLVKEGFQVMTAADRNTCRELVVSHRPDLLILDICLGDPVAGTDVYDELVKSGICDAMPVIFISALEEEGVPPRRSPEGGRIALFGKPFCFETMLEEIRKLLGMDRDRPAEFNIKEVI